jgi:small-conductance mechanosensitive channel
VWFEKSNYVDVKNSVFENIKRRFDAARIEIPYPHVSLYTDRSTVPFPVEIKPEH